MFAGSYLHNKLKRDMKNLTSKEFKQKKKQKFMLIEDCFYNLNEFETHTNIKTY